MIIGIYGAGGFGREIFEMIPNSNLAYHAFKLAFIDDFRIENQSILGVDCLTLQEFQERSANSKIIIAVGAPQLRKLLRERTFEQSFQIQTLISKNSEVSKFAKLEDGVIVSSGVSIANRSSIGFNTAINLGAIIGHDVHVGSDSSISSQVNIGGGSSIGSGTYIGMGTLVREGLTIGSNSIVGMGSVVFHDIPDGVVAVGNPARVVKKNESGIEFSNPNLK